jgi:ABC-2 type transport system permease protein
MTELPRVLAGALVQMPAVWVLGGVALFAFGVLPRQAVGISWAAFIFINVFGEVLGPAMGVDFWIADQLTPFHHVPRILSGGELTAAPLLSLGAITALLMAVGLLAFRRRDLA